MNSSEQSINAVKSFVENLTFDQVKTKAECAPFNFKVSEFGNLYMLSFTDESNMSLGIVRAMNGVIFEKETNNLIHHSFQETFEGAYSEYCKNDKNTFNNFSIFF